MILNDRDPHEIIKYVNRTLLQLIDGHVSPDKLTITKSVKELNQYKSNVPQAVMLRRLNREIKAGERLRYIFVKVDGSQGHKMYTPEEVRSMNLEIDYVYYIETQIRNQTDELLEIIGYKDHIKNLL